MKPRSPEKLKYKVSNVMDSSSSDAGRLHNASTLAIGIVEMTRSAKIVLSSRTRQKCPPRSSRPCIFVPVDDVRAPLRQLGGGNGIQLSEILRADGQAGDWSAAADWASRCEPAQIEANCAR